MLLYMMTQIRNLRQRDGIFCKHSASIMQSWWSVLRSQEPASGREDAWWCLEFQKGMAGMDVLNKHVEQISFRQCITFCEHRQLKGWQPHFQPTVAKSSISTIVHWFAAVTKHNWEHNHLHCNKSSGDHNSVTKPFASACMRQVFFCRLQRRDGHDATIMQRAGGAYCRSQEPASGREWMLGIPKRNGGNRFLKQTCPTNLLLRQWVTFWEHRQLKGWQPHFQPTVAKSSISTTCSLVCSSHIAQLRSTIQCIHQQILETTTVSWPNAMLLCMKHICFLLQMQRRDGKHDASKMQRWWSVAALSGTCFW